MSGKHHKNRDDSMSVTSELAGQRVAAPRSKKIGSLTSASVAVAFAGFSAAVLVAASDGTTPTQPAPQPVPVAAEVQAPQPLQQHGVIVAVTSDTITARSADGFVQTYRVTPDTTAVTQEGGNTFTATAPFAVNDEVAIQATVASGTAIATAVADRAVIGPDGPPMDSI